MEVTAVILAAGASARLNPNKLLLPLDGVPIIERALAACAHLPTIVVASPEVAAACIAGAHADVLINEEARLGMAHSLALAHRQTPGDRALIVLLGDKPLITRRLVDRLLQTARGSRADVCFPQRDGIGGHPVYFSPRARSKIETLAAEDTLQTLRDDATLRRVPFGCDDQGAFQDVDTLEDYRRLKVGQEPPPSD